MDYYTQIFSTPLGPMKATVDQNSSLVQLGFVEEEFSIERKENQDPVSKCTEVVRQLEEYFRGVRRNFEITLAPQGTPFQQRVWAELLRVPFGNTLSYADQSRRLGDPKAVRAVARANGANPICIVIPCHRIIGSDGSLTGYAYGLERKKRLLALENELPLFAKAAQRDRT